MIESKLAVGEIYGLEKELTGLRDQKTGATVSVGLLSQELNGIKKFNLLELMEEIKPIKQITDKLQEELVKEYGALDEKTGSYSIPYYVDVLDENGDVKLDDKGESVKEPNPKLKEFELKMQEILDQTKSLNHEKFDQSYLDFKSKEIYPIFNKLVKNSKTQA